MWMGASPRPFDGKGLGGLRRCTAGSRRGGSRCGPSPARPGRGASSTRASRMRIALRTSRPASRWVGASTIPLLPGSVQQGPITSRCRPRRRDGSFGGSWCPALNREHRHRLEGVRTWNERAARGRPLAGRTKLIGLPRSSSPVTPDSAEASTHRGSGCCASDGNAAKDARPGSQRIDHRDAQGCRQKDRGARRRPSGQHGTAGLAPRSG